MGRVLLRWCNSKSADFIVQSNGSFNMTYLAHYCPTLISKRVYINPCCFCMNNIHLAIAFSNISLMSVLWSVVYSCYRRSYEQVVKYVSMLVFHGCHHQYMIRSSSWYQEMNCFERGSLDSSVMVLAAAQDPMIDAVTQQEFLRVIPDVKMDISTGMVTRFIPIPTQHSEVS